MAVGNGRLRISRHCMRSKDRFLREQKLGQGCRRSRPFQTPSGWRNDNRPSGLKTKGSLAEVQDAKDFGLALAEPGLKPSRKGPLGEKGRSDYLHLCSEDFGPRERPKGSGFEAKWIRLAGSAK
jgi:hypothetical protein